MLLMLLHNKVDAHTHTHTHTHTHKRTQRAIAKGPRNKLDRQENKQEGGMGGKSHTHRNQNPFSEDGSGSGLDSGAFFGWGEST